MARSNFDQWEDSYSATVFESIDALMHSFRELCEDELYSRWNVPVWVNLEEEDNTLSLGLMLTRHGVTTQWILYDATEAHLRTVQEGMMRVWAGRADCGFARFIPIAVGTSDAF